MPRLAPLDLNKLTPEQKKVADAIVAGPRGGLRGPFDPWLRSPHLADRAQKLGEYCRFNNSLPKDLSELAICLVGRHFKAQYEFYAHARLAKEAGFAPENRGGGAPPPVAALHARGREDRLRLRHRIPRDQPRVGAQLQARRRRLRRTGRCRSGGRVRLLHAGVDDAQRLRDALAARRAGSAGLAIGLTVGLMSFLLFLAAASIIAVSPGPGIFYVAARTLADGRAVGLASSLGTGVGGLVHVAAGAPCVSGPVPAGAPGL